MTSNSLKGTLIAIAIGLLVCRWSVGAQVAPPAGHQFPSAALADGEEPPPACFRVFGQTSSGGPITGSYNVWSHETSAWAYSDLAYEFSGSFAPGAAYVNFRGTVEVEREGTVCCSQHLDFHDGRTHVYVLGPLGTPYRLRVWVLGRAHANVTMGFSRVKAVRWYPTLVVFANRAGDSESMSVEHS